MTTTQQAQTQATPTLPPNLVFVARNCAKQYVTGHVSSLDVSREFQRIASSGWHGDPYDALQREWDAEITRLLDAGE
jgi:hypothetical protein